MIDAGYSVATVKVALEDLARVNGYPATEVVVFPTALPVTARGVDEWRTGVVSSGHSPLLLHQAEELDDVVEAACAGDIDPATTRGRIRALRAMPPPYTTGQRVIAYMLLSAGLAVLLGASWSGVGVAAALGSAVGTGLLLGDRAPTSTGRWSQSGSRSASRSRCSSSVAPDSTPACCPL